MKNDTRRSVNEWRLLDLKCIIIRRVRGDVFVLAAHTLASWGGGGLRTAACPCVTRRNSHPPSSGRPLYLLFVYERKVALDKDGDCAL